MHDLSVMMYYTLTLRLANMGKCCHTVYLKSAISPRKRLHQHFFHHLTSSSSLNCSAGGFYIIIV